MNSKIVAIAGVTLVTVVTSCSPFYVLRAGYEEARILARRQPIAEVIEDPATPAAQRDKLALVLQARDYAERVLRLDTGDSYTLYSELDRDTLALVLSAARKDRFEQVTWWFPIVGRVPYRGYFNPRSAERAAERMENRGYDTFVRPISAFSTLGWFNDPLLSTLLRHNEVNLVNTVIHELTHNTIYLPGQAAFNESFATFVGDRGAADFFCDVEGEESARCQRARGIWQDNLVFGAYLSGLIRRLEALYARDGLELEALLAAREEIFREERLRFSEEVQPRFVASSFEGFRRAPLNNASILARRTYYDRLHLFEAVYQRLGGDLPAVIAAIVEAAESRRDDPYAALEELARSAADSP